MTMVPNAHHFSKKPDLVVDLENSDGVITDRAFVTSGSIANASPVWRWMVDPSGGFKQHPMEKFRLADDDTELPVLSLDDDDIDTVLMLFRIMHLQMKEVPKALMYYELLDVAVVCDKYNCVDLVFPWADGWVGALLDEIDLEDYYEDEFGYEGWFLIATLVPSRSDLDEFLYQLSILLIGQCCVGKPSSSAGGFGRRVWTPPLIFSSRILNKSQLHETARARVVNMDIIPAPIVEHIYKEAKTAVHSLTQIAEELCRDLYLFEGIALQGEKFSDLHLKCKDDKCIRIARSTLFLSLQQKGFELKSPESLKASMEAFPVTFLCESLSSLSCQTIVPISFDVTVKNPVPEGANFMCLQEFPKSLPPGKYLYPYLPLSPFLRLLCSDTNFTAHKILSTFVT
ncbi:hypothetical protein TWF696_000287 [Orbilia brochopaga]|uniref:Uncharacterized protein n=1 Tax=Orbilia brochopaga TaxID=3140254 RepID=A0AAV9VAY1_9PEZI